jgi:peptidoglycan/xylan/chitin deacetylase (PgdA/CDA1 family)
MEPVPVLMYHQICADGTFEASDFIVGRKTFRQQLQYLAESGFYTPSLSEVLSGQLAPKGKKPVILTFDDGYLNNYEHAFPELKDVGFRAVISIVADPNLRTNSWDAQKGIPSAELMHPDHLLELEAGGIEFTSHSYTHKSMPSLYGHDLEKELVQSKRWIEDVLNHPIVGFTYPYGDVDERVKKAVRSAGYSLAFATHSGPLDIYSDLWEIRRMLIGNRDDEPYFFSKFSGLDRTVMWGKWFAKKLLGKHNKFQFELSGDVLNPQKSPQ